MFKMTQDCSQYNTTLGLSGQTEFQLNTWVILTTILGYFKQMIGLF